MLLGGAGAAAAIALGIILYIRNQKNETVAVVNVPDGTKVEIVTTPGATATATSAATPSATTSSSVIDVTPRAFATATGGTVPKVTVSTEPVIVVGPNGALATNMPADTGSAPASTGPRNLTPAEVQSAQQGWAAYLQVPVQVNVAGVDLRLIPPGNFLMGASPQQVEAAVQWDVAESPGANADGLRQTLTGLLTPRHLAVMHSPYLIGRTKVTVGQFRRFVEATNYVTETEKAGGGRVLSRPDTRDPNLNWRTPGRAVTDDTPVTQVTWNDAVAYCAWLDQQLRGAGSAWAGRLEAVKLPSETQWEHACRAGTMSMFWFGDDPAGLNQTDWLSNDGVKGPQPVARRQANPYGLFDLYGNVMEWCHEAPRDYSAGPQGMGTSAVPDLRAIRGSVWYRGVAYSARRGRSPASHSADNLGFRVMAMFKASDDVAGAPPGAAVVPEAAPDVATTTPATTTTAATTTSQATSSSANAPIVCEKLEAKAPAMGLAGGAVAFTGPPGANRSGANGIVVDSPAGWQQSGTMWEFDYLYDTDTAQGVQVVHPMEGGHVRLNIHRDRIALSNGGQWVIIGGDPYLNTSSAGGGMIASAAATIMPLQPNVTYRIETSGRPGGYVSVKVNGTLLKMSQVPAFQPQGMKPPFTDAKCPATLGAGQAALIIGPVFTGRNAASSIRFTTAGPAPHFAGGGPPPAMQTGPSPTTPQPAAVASATTTTTGGPAPFMPQPFTIGGAAPGVTTIRPGAGGGSTITASATGLADVLLLGPQQFTRSKASERFIAGEMPAYLQQAVALQLVQTKLKFDAALGLADFRVSRPGKLYMAVSYQNDGVMAAPEVAERWDQRRLNDEGWTKVEDKTVKLDLMPLGTAPLEEPHTIYVRDCTQGDLFRIRTRKYHPPVLFVAPEDAATTPFAGLVPSTNTTARTTDATLIVGNLESAQPPSDVVAGAIPFRGPKGDRGDGANGIAVDAPHDYKTLGSVWRMNFSTEGEAEGVSIIHPFGTGHVRAQLLRTRVDLFINGTWGSGTKVYSSGSSYPKSSNSLATKVFPLTQNLPHVLVSKLDAAGNYELSIDGIWVARAKIATPKALKMIPPFLDTAVPPTLNAGQAALVVGSTFDQTNRVSEARLEPATGNPATSTSSISTPAPAVGTTPTRTPTTAAPPAVAVSQRAVADRTVAGGGRVRIRTPDGVTKSVSSAAEFPPGDFDIVDITIDNGQNVSDADLQVFGTLPQLERLNITNSRITGAGLAYIKDLKQLTQLRIDRCPLSDAGLDHIGNLKTLTFLNIAFTQISDAGLQKLTGLTDLRTIYVQNTRITTAGMAHLATMPSLDNINVDQLPITDDGVDQLKKLPLLRTLALRGTRVTNLCVQTLAQIKTLRTIYLDGAAVSPQALAFLRQQLPQARVTPL